MTRAKSGLVVIGDSRTLNNERHWKAFVDWCRAEGCYVSSPLRPDVLSTLYASARPVAPYIAPVASHEGRHIEDEMEQNKKDENAHGHRLEQKIEIDAFKF